MSIGARQVRVRIIVAGILAILVVLLLLHARESGGHPGEPDRTPPSVSMDMLIDSLLIRNGVDPTDVKKWRVKNREGGTIRIERDVKVPSDLVTLEFNRDLNQEVGRYGALVSASERTRESTVVLHVVAGGKTVQTIQMQTAPDISGTKTATR